MANRKNRVLDAATGGTKATKKPVGRPPTGHHRRTVQANMPDDARELLKAELRRWVDLADADPGRFRVPTVDANGHPASRLPDKGDVLSAALRYWLAKCPEAKRTPRG